MSKQSSTPYHWLTPGYYKDKVKTSSVHLDHMLGSFSKTKAAIMAAALTKTIRKYRKLMDKFILSPHM